MGMWDTVKTYTPDLSSVYSYSSNTISKVDNIVRDNLVPKVTEILPDVKNCGKIGQKMNDHMHALTDTVKTYTPDLSSVYSYSSNTISKVYNVVPKVTESLPDVKNCGKIGQKMNDHMHALTDTVKTYTPNLSSVYSYSSNTISKVYNVVPKVTESLPDVKNCGKILQDKENRAMVGKFAWDLGKNAVVLGMHEGVKFVPGGSFVHQAVLRSLPKEKDESLIKEVKTLQTRISKLEKHATESGNSYEAGEISSSNIEPNSQTASVLSSNMKFQEPEDVIRVFMMKGFVGRDINQQILENLMVPGVGKYQK